MFKIANRNSSNESNIKRCLNYFIGKLHLIILIVAFFIGLFIFQDYGIAWDDPIQRQIGQVTYNYLFHSNDLLLTYSGRHYGTVIELPLVLIEKLFHLSDLREIYFMRHFVLHLFFIFGVYFFYKFVVALFGDKKIGIIAMLLLLCNPILYAHSFYNSKDLPFMVFIILSIYTLLKAVQKPNSKTIVWHALLSALALNARIMGLLIPFITIAIFLMELFIKNRSKSVTFKLMLLYGISLIGFYIISWPALWHNPIIHTYETLKRLAIFPWINNEVFYLGNMYPVNDLPWHYLIVSLTTTTPIIFSLIILFGLFRVVIDIKSQGWHFFKSVNSTLISIFIFLPFLLLFYFILSDSTFYDSWRHVFFLYPFLTISALYFLVKITQVRIKFAIYSLLVLVFLNLIYQMAKLHPYQQLYYNNLVSHKSESLRSTFELDYWGLSYKQGLEYILLNDNRSQIIVKAENIPGQINSLILKKSSRCRIFFTNSDHWDYFISNYRNHPHEYLLDNMVFTIKRENSTILSVFKAK